ncbi:MAG: helix-turn-helix domain-containing protein [Candidatus Thorarchaeota archaeon]|jgi:transcriptional regulator with XRE-family HTH domain
MKENREVTKAELARQLGISRAYATMLAKGHRHPSKKLQKKIDKLTNECSLPATRFRVWDHEVGGSSPPAPTPSCCS